MLSMRFQLRWFSSIGLSITMEKIWSPWNTPYRNKIIYLVKLKKKILPRRCIHKHVRHSICTHIYIFAFSQIYVNECIYGETSITITPHHTIRSSSLLFGVIYKSNLWYTEIDTQTVSEYVLESICGSRQINCGCKSKGHILVCVMVISYDLWRLFIVASMSLWYASHFLVL